MFDPIELERLQKKFEEVRQFPYDDATGKPPVIRGNLTIGLGWNLTKRGLPDYIINILYRVARDEAVHQCMNHFPWFKDLDDVRQMVMVDMVFNMGLGSEHEGFLSFKNMIHHLSMREYKQAADHMLASKWRHQVGNRAIILASMMETGEFPIDV